MQQPTIGVLALQGDFDKHCHTLTAIGVPFKQVRKPEDLIECKGLIIPGGESTVMLKQMNAKGLDKEILKFAQDYPVFGTCAGLILMSNQIQSSSLCPLQLLDIEVERNAFGRQVDSFKAAIEIRLQPDTVHSFEAYFIRAPRIRAYQETIEVLAFYEGEPIIVRQGYHLGATFHPELTNDPLIHQYFMQIVQQRLNGFDKFLKIKI